MATKYVKRTFIRPNISVPFYTSDSAFVTEIENSVTSTNSCIKWREPSLSINQLTLTWTSSWNADFIDSERGMQFTSNIKVLLDTDMLSAKNYCNEFEILMSELIVYTE